MAKTLKIGNLLKKLEEIYKKIDKELQEKFGDSIVCKKGCALCCQKYQVHTKAIEAVNIVAFLNSNLTPQEKEKLWKKIKSSNIIQNLTGEINTKCSFLNSLNACIIYPVRPFICRIYISSSLEECKKGLDPSLMQQPEFVRLVEIYREGINKLDFQLLYEIKGVHRTTTYGHLYSQIKLINKEFVLLLKFLNKAYKIKF